MQYSEFCSKCYSLIVKITECNIKDYAVTEVDEEHNTITLKRLDSMVKSDSEIVLTLEEIINKVEKEEITLLNPSSLVALFGR